MDKDPVQHEREYLEALLNTRFNFFLLVMSGVGAALLAEGDLSSLTSALLLALGGTAGAAMGLIILRTSALLGVILDVMAGRRYSDGVLLPVPSKAERAAGTAPPLDLDPERHLFPDNSYRMAAGRVGKERRLLPNANRVINLAAASIPLLLFAAAAASHWGAFDKQPAGCKAEAARPPAAASSKG